MNTIQVVSLLIFKSFIEFEFDELEEDDYQDITTIKVLLIYYPLE